MLDWFWLGLARPIFPAQTEDLAVLLLAWPGWCHRGWGDGHVASPPQTCLPPPPPPLPTPPPFPIPTHTPHTHNPPKKTRPPPTHSHPCLYWTVPRARSCHCLALLLFSLYIKGALWGNRSTVETLCWITEHLWRTHHQFACSAFFPLVIF